jgi:hypothetical protein
MRQLAAGERELAPTQGELAPTVSHFYFFCAAGRCPVVEDGPAMWSPVVCTR